jgi:predicted nucleic acid-binding protein
VILLDAYGLVALLADEPAAGEVERLLAEEAGIGVVNLAEALDVLQRVHGFSLEEVREPVELLGRTGLEITIPKEGHAWRAAELRARHYHHQRRPVSIADCLLAAAAGPDDRLATSDLALARVASSEGIDVIALPDTAGRRPAV